MGNSLENLIRCPQCRKAFCAMEASGKNLFSCPECQASYPVANGVIDLVPDLQFKRTVAQRFMESPAVVNVYESKLWRRSAVAGWIMGIPFDREAERITRAAQVDKASAVLDLACGPGIYTRPFARALKQGRVVGLDLSMPMLQWGARKAEKEKLGNVAYVRASALDLPFENASFDVVNCCGALHLFPDPDKALDEVGRVLKPGGRFTAAVVREGKGLLGRISSRRSLSMGVRSFTGDALKQTLKSKGLEKAAIHHDSAFWLILSAVKS